MLGWMEEQDIDDRLLNVGIAHGALVGVSPDRDQRSYPMTRVDLRGLKGIRLRLLGDTHFRHPDDETVPTMICKEEALWLTHRSWITGSNR